MTRATVRDVLDTDKHESGSPRDVGRRNASLVLTAVLADGALPRAAIADRVGLTRGTVTRVTARLIAMNLLKELDPDRSQFGRPLTPLDLAVDSRAVATVHLGSAEVRIGLVGLRGEVLTEVRFGYETTDPTRVVSTIAGRLTDLLDGSTRPHRVLGVGVSIGGWVDAEAGVVVHYAPLGWRDVPLASMIADALRLPILFDQMVRGIALGEMMFGAARGTRDFIELYVGNIVGAALINEGVPRRGPHGAAGIIGHFPIRGSNGIPCSCGRSDCLQSVASDLAVVSQARAEGTLGSGEGMENLIAQARAGNRSAAQILKSSARYLGQAAASMVDLVNPSLLVLAGNQALVPGYLAAFTETLGSVSEHALDNSILVSLSTLGDGAPTIASGAIFLDAYYRDPFTYEGARSSLTIAASS